MVKSKYEVVKYLGSNPAANAKASPRDFYFESRPEDAPPARRGHSQPRPATRPAPRASERQKRRPLCCLAHLPIGLPRISEVNQAARARSSQRGPTHRRAGATAARPRLTHTMPLPSRRAAAHPSTRSAPQVKMQKIIAALALSGAAAYVAPVAPKAVSYTHLTLPTKA